MDNGGWLDQVDLLLETDNPDDIEHLDVLVHSNKRYTKSGRDTLEELATLNGFLVANVVYIKIGLCLHYNSAVQFHSVSLPSQTATLYLSMMTPFQQSQLSSLPAHG